MFAIAWPGFRKFSQVIMLYEIYFIKHYHLFFLKNIIFHYEPKSAYLYYWDRRRRSEPTEMVIPESRLDKFQSRLLVYHNRRQRDGWRHWKSRQDHQQYRQYGREAHSSQQTAKPSRKAPVAVLDGRMYEGR